MVLRRIRDLLLNGDLVRLAFIIDAHDREIIAWHAVANLALVGI
jgi:hypothetical protein